LPADATSFDDWQVIDRAEVARARPNRLRSKFTTREAMTDVINEHRSTSPTDDDVTVADEQ
jgi:ferredoxin--NADP+ reductase